jgi:hypothetical protein
MNKLKSIKGNQIEDIGGLRTIYSPNGNRKGNILDTIAFTLSTDLRITDYRMPKDFVVEERKDSNNTSLSLSISKRN